MTYSSDHTGPSSEDSFDIAQIMDKIPHRYPFLLVDRMIQIVRGVSAVGIKNVTYNEPHFVGHFPKHPIMPGVLIVEALAQTAGALVVASLDEVSNDHLVYFMSIDGAHFRRPVIPGDTLYLHVTKERQRGKIWRFTGEAKVADVRVADAVFTAMITNSEPT